MGSGIGTKAYAILDPVTYGIGYATQKVAKAIGGAAGDTFGGVMRSLSPALGKAGYDKAEGKDYNDHGLLVDLGQDAVKAAIFFGTMGIGSAISGAGSATAAAGGSAAATTGESAATAAASGINWTNLISGGVGLAAAGLQGYTGVQATRLEAEALKRQAELNEIRANQTIEGAEREAIDVARHAKQAKKTGIAQLAANGIMVDDTRRESAPSIFLDDSDLERAYDQTKIMEEAALRAWGYDVEAGELRRAARVRKTSGYISAASTAISSGLQAWGATKSLLR